MGDTSKVEGVGTPDRFQEKEFDPHIKYCYDSPGTVSKDQEINLLTAEEISATLATSPLLPRTFLLKLDQTVLLGGIARLDYVEGPEIRRIHPIMVTVFCCQSLPINILQTVGVEQFLNIAPGTKNERSRQCGEVAKFAVFPGTEGDSG